MSYDNEKTCKDCWHSFEYEAEHTALKMKGIKNFDKRKCYDCNMLDVKNGLLKPNVQPVKTHANARS